MEKNIHRVVILGGGSAGWLTAGIIAAEHAVGSNSGSSDPSDGFQLILVESPDISTIGVGEGTWPSMRSTLQKMGISETEFFRECSASFKQGTLFKNWLGSDKQGSHDSYIHPFTVPQSYADTNLAPHWQLIRDQVNFADAVCPQSALAEGYQAPKKISTPEYAFQLNYGYHLDAGKFAELLRAHCVDKLGVIHIKANVEGINSAANGDIASIVTDRAGTVEGDLFVDCSGSRSLLLGEHYQVPMCSKRQYLFNNTALAAQVAYGAPEDPIQSFTLSTAQSAGWIWDIGLPSRRGIGHVYSDAHNTEDRAREELMAYIEASAGKQAADQAMVRKIQFEPGHRAEFWHKNCVAIGMSAGFIEPLEASALVLVELSAAMIAEQLPANRKTMDLVAKRFNDKFLYRWDRIIDFLKLHYILSQREGQYWQDHRDPASIPDHLAEQVALWRHQSPWHRDSAHVDELFPSASFQYVLYGMGFETKGSTTARRSEQQAYQRAGSLFQENAKRTQQLQASLPTNRELINKICSYGMQKI
ncbi:MAG: tryptophan 7-halogenase [Porticoccaceae bacterium]|jgi:tryptophan halogenase|nr:tryptophan 7-halogenase [Porticoccaceae bacterium]MDG1705408.1 tryptophan 7-halogenase [Porticoccaceae bacterium]